VDQINASTLTGRNIGEIWRGNVEIWGNMEEIWGNMEEKWEKYEGNVEI
jgi:hypothetical protein